jgi:uncharacterized cofD-like protein
MPLPKIVVVGGGSGTSVVLAGLKEHAVDLTAVVSVADSGGSTGRLRDEFGFQPVGDLRQSLAALSSTDSEDALKQLLLYRFNQGTFEGHSLGNLILTALQDMTGTTAGALATAHRILHIDGQILPVTEQNVQLVVEYEDGEFRLGEHCLDEDTCTTKKIRRVLLSPRGRMFHEARQAIIQADLVVIGPGDYWGSIMAALAVSDTKATFKKTRGQIVYILNLMTRASQTHGLTAQDHVRGLEKRLGRPLDHVIINNAPLPRKIIATYAAQQEFPVIDDLPHDKTICRAPIINTVPYHQNPADRTRRSLLRHDPIRLAQILLSKLK